MKWKYTSLEHVGRCRIDGQPIKMRFRLSITEEGRTFPDVLIIERILCKLFEWLDEGSTLEEYTEMVRDRLDGKGFRRPGSTLTGLGSTATHGEIEYEVSL